MSAQNFLPYGRQHITEEDIKAVLEVLQSDWLTQGPAVANFEDALCDYIGARNTVVCSSGTAALHLAMLALGLEKGDAVVTVPNTFVASANCARLVGAEVRFVDIDPETGLMDIKALETVLQNDQTHKIKAVIPVHFAGQPVDLPAIYGLAKSHGAWVVDDACHAIGADYTYNSKALKIGGNPHSDLTVFSFHPVKHIACGEGGAVTTDYADLADRLRLFRNHGIVRRNFVNSALAETDGVPNSWYYEMVEMGLNYRLTDIQAALGASQLRHLPDSLARRRRLAGIYRDLIRNRFKNGEVVPLGVHKGVGHAYHLFVVRIDFEKLNVSRAVVMNRLRAKGVGTQVHYIPVHLQPYYRRNCGTGPGNFPGSESYYRQTLTLPMYPDLTDDNLRLVVDQLAEALIPVSHRQTLVQ